MSKQKVQNYLHELIKNLSQTEKRYFKLLAKQQTPGKKNDYIKLFEEIDKQDVFDEEKIKEKFKGTPIEKRYASLKKYLYELVVKSLTFYNADTISSIKVRRMLDAAEILQRKGLYHQAIRKLKKAEIMAEEVGMHFILHDIRRLRISCQSMSGEFPVEEEFEAFKEKQNEITQSLSLTNEIHNKSLDTVYYAMYTNEGTSIFNKEKYKDIVNEDFLKLEPTLKSNYNKHIYYNTLKRYHSVLKEGEKSKEYNDKHIDLFESGELNKRHLPSNYIHSIMNKLEGLNIENDEQEINHWLDVCKLFFDDNSTSYYNKNNDYAHLLCLEQNYALQRNDTKKINSITKVVEDFIQNKRNKINVFAHRWLVYNQAWTAIKNKDLKGALQYSNTLLNDKHLSKSHFLYTPSVIQNIVIHFELKNFSYLEFAIKSFQKELKKHCNFTESESLVFDFFFQNLNKIGSSNISNHEIFQQLFKRYKATSGKPMDFSTKLMLNWIGEKSGNIVEPVLN